MFTPIQKFPLLGKEAYIKREDLLGGLFNGSKQRKIQTLIEDIKNRSPKRVVIKGSIQSNFIVAFVQQLIPLQIPFIIAFSRYPEKRDLKGNYFFLEKMIQNENIFLIDNYTPQEEEYVIEEGGDQLQGYLGLLNLATELKEQMKATPFDHIWIDAGTGSTAACLLYGLQECEKKPTLHVVSMHDDEKTFIQKMTKIKLLLDTHFGKQSQDLSFFQFYRPPTAKSFGSVNQTVLKTIRMVAKESGILLDPIYTAKLFITACNHPLEGTVCFLHSGGTLSLSAF
jgi:1-aminocyclopropane-1-carboxylate deaminase/D-cysteine desulfhydrase-like pyridoxal-dependent ACC family enzyme